MDETRRGLGEVTGIAAPTPPSHSLATSARVEQVDLKNKPHQNQPKT